MTTKDPRCEADLERHSRAASGSTLIERTPPMERRIEFQVGYDHRRFTCGHGCHGMSLRFIFLGPAGATQWMANMPNWMPGNTDIIGNIQGELPISFVPTSNQIGDGYPVDLGYHSPRPLYEGHEGRDRCIYLPEGTCYYDGSGLNAQPVLEAFLEHGPMAVWATLARYYNEVFHTAEAET